MGLPRPGCRAATLGCKALPAAALEAAAPPARCRAGGISRDSSSMPFLLQENKLGQKFVVDATLYTDLGPAGRSDDLAHTINYAKVYE